jgi:Plasmid pRiA4b ORF-3-like protein
MPRKIDTAPIYQIKITLLGIRPAIWRRVLVSSGLSLGKLHAVMQATMGWYGGHLHQFEVPSGEDVTYYGPTSGFFPMDEWKNETRTKVGQCLQQPGDRMLYTYDLGDSWEHLLELEEILPPNPKHKAVCTIGICSKLLPIPSTPNMKAWSNG